MKRSCRDRMCWGGGLLLPFLIVFALEGCMPPPAKPPVLYSDKAPHALPPIPRERPFDGSLFAPGGLSDLASDAVASRMGDPVIVRFGIKNGYPGVPQKRVTKLMAQVIREEPGGSLLISAQRTIRDSSGVRRLVLVGRISKASIDPGNEVPVSLVAMLRFRSDQPSDNEKNPRFSAPKVPSGKKGQKPGVKGAKTRSKNP